MKLLRYTGFSSDLVLNENLDQAKKLLRDTYKLNKALKSVSDVTLDSDGIFITAKDGAPIKFRDLPDDVQANAKQKFREVKLDTEETRKVERGSIIQKIRELLGDKLGYAYMFTYFFVVEKVPLDELKDILLKLVDYRDLLSAKNPVDNKPLLRKPISNYIDVSIPNNSENLIDDLENISLYKSTRKIYNELTPELKKDYESQPPVIKKQVDDLSLAFAKLGMTEGVIDKHLHERLWKLFFGETKIVDGKTIYAGQMRRFKNIREFIKSAQNYLKSIDNTETLKFYESIEKCNQMYQSYGAQVILDDNNILILEIKSFQANQLLNSHTRHCIKDTLSQWDYYVGGETVYNKQYYIYNFNLPSYDTKSVIGITIAPGQSIMACHLKDDGGFKDSIENQLKSWEREYGVSDLFKLLLPMEPKEIEAKKKRVVANREIVKKGLSLDRVKQLLLEDGADVNSGKGEALDNAVADGDLEKVKYLLEFGASPNLRSKQESSINKIKDLEDSKVAFEILKYLLRAGSELTSTVFRGLIGEIDAVKFCLENGLDPNFEDGFAVRLAIRRGYYDILMLLVKNGAQIKGRFMLAWAFESCKIGGGGEDVIKYLINNGFSKLFEKNMDWVGHSPRLDAKEKVDVLKIMQKYIDDGTVVPSATGYKIFNDNGSTLKVDGTYDEVIKKYGNLYNWTIKCNYEELKDAL